MLGTRYIPELLFTALSPSFPPPTHSFGSSNTGVLAILQTYISTLSFHHKLLPFALVIPRAWDILPSDICMFGCSLCQLCTWILLPQKPLVTQGPHTLVSTHKLVLVIVWGFFFLLLMHLSPAGILYNFSFALVLSESSIGMNAAQGQRFLFGFVWVFVFTARS